MDVILEVISENLFLLSKDDNLTLLFALNEELHSFKLFDIQKILLIQSSYLKLLFGIG